MTAIFLQILPLFAIMLLGGLFGRLHSSFNQKTVSELNRFAYFIGFPSIIIQSFLAIEEIPWSEVELALVNIVMLVIFSLLVLSLTGLFLKNTSLRNTYFICVFFGNVAYLGFPLISSLGSQYNTSLSLHIAGYLIVLFTLGIARLEMTKENGQFKLRGLLRSIFLNPLLLATLVGLIMVSLEIKLPALAQNVVSMIASSASPVVLFALGIFISRSSVDKASIGHATALSIIKLLLLPLIFFTVSATLYAKTDMTVSIIIAAMPVAITPFVLTEIYNMNKKIIASAIVISTILSIFNVSFG